MKNIFESVIARGGYDLGSLLKKIDVYHIEGKLTDEEKDELYHKARGEANVINSIDIMAKLMELEDRVRKLEQDEPETEPETPDTPDTPAEVYPEYVPGKWYRAGDKITFGGKNYVCSAPEGVVCTWNPDEYPAYWSIEE